MLSKIGTEVANVCIRDFFVDALYKSTFTYLLTITK